MHRQLAIDALLKVTQGYTGIPSRSLLASAEIDERYPEKLFIIAVPKILRMAGSASFGDLPSQVRAVHGTTTAVMESHRPDWQRRGDDSHRLDLICRAWLSETQATVRFPAAV